MCSRRLCLGVNLFKCSCMRKIQILIFCALTLVACNQQPKEIKASAPKGELAFLLQYNNRLPSDVGFLTNHIMERRMANLMKENYEPFMKDLGKENPLIVDSINQAVFARFNGSQGPKLITVSVADDALWIDYAIGDKAVRYVDRTSLSKPVWPN